MKKLAGLVFTVVFVGFLTGCDNKLPKKEHDDHSLYLYQVNGKPLECVVGSGISCNWEKHNKLFPEGVSN